MMLKLSQSLILLAALLTASCNHATNFSVSSSNPIDRPFVISSEVHDPVAFEPHPGYLAMNILFFPVRGLFDEVQDETDLDLITRGEAHITVLAPKEYAAVSQVLGDSGINGIAERSKIQSSKFEIVCLGRGTVKENSTFFIVVKSPDLVKIRQTVLDEYAAKGGKGQPFEANHYYPHITVGFTKTDLHEEQGVIKDQRSCIAKIVDANMTVID